MANDWRFCFAMLDHLVYLKTQVFLNPLDVPNGGVVGVVNDRWE